jgi:cytoskeletal protein CcmA (bactofilin family)
MFAFNRKGTVIAEGLKIVGTVSADGAVEVNGQVEGDLHCASLTVSPKASINGGIHAGRVVVNGKVEGPISGKEVVLKSRAFVVGDIQTQSLSIERGAHFEGRSVRPKATNLAQIETMMTNGRGEPNQQVRPAVIGNIEPSKVARA